MDDPSSVGIKIIAVAFDFQPEVFVVCFQKLGSEVDLDFFLIKISKAKIKIHIKRLVTDARFPKQVVERVFILTREKDLAVDVSDISKNKRDAPVLLAVVKVHNELRVRQKVRVDTRVGNRAHNGQDHFIFFNYKFFHLDLVFHKNTSVITYEKLKSAIIQPVYSFSRRCPQALSPFDTAKKNRLQTYPLRIRAFGGRGPS